jgi:carboxypeptidase Taq
VTYTDLEGRFARIGDLMHVASIMGWDEAVMMPASGGAARADAMGTLSGLIHELRSDPILGELLAAARETADADGLDAWQRANLGEMERSYQRATAVPRELVEELARAATEAEQAWRRLRPRNDWQGFSPLLQRLVSLSRDKATVLGDALGLSPYDALMDAYEPGGRSATIDLLFEELGAVLPDLIERIIERQAGEPVVEPVGPFPVDAQRRLGERLMRAVGLDLSRARLDVSHHPFCGGVPSDVRITTRYDESDFTSSLMGVLHETGHAKYEQGLPERWHRQPVGQARGMAVHESQSLLLEMQVCRGPDFLAFAAPIIRQELAEAAARQPGAFELSNLRRLYTRVERSFIRVDADEVTYPCHIILRYEIERKLISGEMRVAEIPEAWDAGMRRLLEISTGDDHRNGCMQDVHWAAAAFGYFPTYTLGAMTAAQLYRAALRDVPSIPGELQRGDFTGLDGWLREKVWSRASSSTTDGLLMQATGEPLGARPFLEHLRERYLGEASVDRGAD